MKYAIIVSEKDLAGMNIKNQFILNFNFEESKEIFDNNEVLSLKNTKNQVKIYTIKKETVFFEKLDEKIEADKIIFATKHVAASGNISLCVHVQGNYNSNDHGGSANIVGYPMSSEIKSAHKELIHQVEKRKLELTVVQEATHHGPNLNTPSMFIEIGSSEKEWKNDELGLIIAETIFKLVTKSIEPKREFVVIGGGHYNYVADKINRQTNYCVGHIIPKYAMEFIDSEMIDQIIEKSESKEKVTFIFDWKGCINSGIRKIIIDILDKKNITWVRSDKFFK